MKELEENYIPDLSDVLPKPDELPASTGEAEADLGFAVDG